VPIWAVEKTVKYDNSRFSPEDKAKFYGHPDHVRRYAHLDYLKLLESAKFYVEAANFTKTIKEEDIRRFGIHKNELIYVCSNFSNNN